MAMTRRRKWCIGIAVFLFVFFFVIPPLLGLCLRGYVERKISRETNAPARLGSLWITLLPPGAGLSNLELGETDPRIQQPLVKLDHLHASVGWGTIFGGPLRVTSLSLGGEIHLACDENGESALGRFVNGMPLSEPAKEPKYLDEITIRDMKIHFHAPGKLANPGGKRAVGTAKVEIRRLSLRDLVIPATGRLWPEGRYLRLSVNGLSLRAPFADAAEPPPPIKSGAPSLEGLELERATAEIALPSDSAAPVRIRRVEAIGLRVRDLQPEGETRTLLRLVNAALACTSIPPPKSPPPPGPEMSGAIHVEEAEGGGIAALFEQGASFWCVEDLQLSARRLGVREGAEPPPGETGFLKIKTLTRSNEGDGRIVLEWSELTGAYPKWSFKNKLEIEGLALAPFADKVRKGRAAASFEGEARQGRLSISGKVWLTKDLDLTVPMGNFIADVVLPGKAIEPVKIVGTLEKPELDLPNMVPAVLAGIFRGLCEKGLLPLQGMGKEVVKNLGEEAGKTLQGLKDLPKSIVEKPLETIKKDINTKAVGTLLKKKKK